MKKNSLLIMLHCEQDTGYAIEPLEKTFHAAAILAGYQEDKILWSYSKVNTPKPKTYELSYKSKADAKNLEKIHKEHCIEAIIAFDMPYPSTVCGTARSLGIKSIVSYWGASMSSINNGIKLLAKKLEWQFKKRNAPTLFIFESVAMKKTATHGRGIPEEKTCVIPLGVDTSVYYPEPNFSYAHDQFNIPLDRKIIFYSGHMEERKGIRVLVEAMNTLAEQGKIEQFHLLICGNKNDESTPYERLLKGKIVKTHVTFAGYRSDIPELMRSSYIGVIASTGWDSFTMSSVEMLASGLPLIVSELQGLKETIEPGKCGEYIQPGDFLALAEIIKQYTVNPAKYKSHSQYARQRATDLFSNTVQIKRISETLI